MSHGLNVSPLTPEETRWLRRLERVLRDQPRRILIVESGDWLTIVDRDAAREVELCDGGARDAGIVLADVRHSGMKVTGVSG